MIQAPQDHSADGESPPCWHSRRMKRRNIARLLRIGMIQRKKRATAIHRGTGTMWPDPARPPARRDGGWARATPFRGGPPSPTSGLDRARAAGQIHDTNRRYGHGLLPRIRRRPTRKAGSTAWGLMGRLPDPGGASNWHICCRLRRTMTRGPEGASWARLVETGLRPETLGVRGGDAQSRRGYRLVVWPRIAIRTIFSRSRNPPPSGFDPGTRGGSIGLARETFQGGGQMSGARAGRHPRRLEMGRAAVPSRRRLEGKAALHGAQPRGGLTRKGEDSRLLGEAIMAALRLIGASCGERTNHERIHELKRLPRAVAWWCRSLAVPGRGFRRLARASKAASA